MARGQASVSAAYRTPPLGRHRRAAGADRRRLGPRHTPRTSQSAITRTECSRAACATVLLERVDRFTRKAGAIGEADRGGGVASAAGVAAATRGQAGLAALRGAGAADRQPAPGCDRV